MRRSWKLRRSTRHLKCARRCDMAQPPGFDVARLRQLGVPVTQLCSDSRRLQPSDVFVAIPGERVDARTLIPQAIRAGASAVIWEAEAFTWNSTWRVPNLPVHDLR